MEAGSWEEGSLTHILTKIPGMPDEDLATLHSNAERLERSGTGAQQKSATALLPAVRAEIQARQEAKLAVARDNAALRKERSRTTAKSRKARPAAEE